MKKFLAIGLLLCLALFLAPVATELALASPTATIDCGFASSGRGGCSATPTGGGYSYEWWVSGSGSVADRDAPFTSAACTHSPYSGTIYVRVTDAAGNSDVAYTSSACPD